MAIFKLLFHLPLRLILTSILSTNGISVKDVAGNSWSLAHFNRSCGVFGRLGLISTNCGDIPLVS